MQAAEALYHGNFLCPLQFVRSLIILFSVPFLLAGCAKTAPVNTEPVDITVLQKWSGEYPVSELGRLPEEQRHSAAGYIGDAKTFLSVWRVFMPTEILPAVDFNKNIVVFSRNTQFYNRTAIFKVTLQDGTAEILAMETMSAIPIEDKVAMAMAVIPRAGVMAIQSGAVTVEVKPYK